MNITHFTLIATLAINTLTINAQEPFYELKDLENQYTTYDELKGEKLTVLDFWATWCQPCLRSIPALNDLYSEMSPKGVEFIGISVDGPRNQAKLKPFVNSLSVNYPILRDVNSEVMSDMNVTSVPTLMLLDEDGTVLYLHEGYRPGDEDLIRENILKHL